MTTAVALRLTDPSPPPDALSSLTEIRAARKAQRDLKRREICAIASFADTLSSSDRADERDLVPYGCDGTPLVQEFAGLELAAALAISDEAASMTLGCVLNVRHRLPLAWQAFREDRLSWFVCERLDNATHDLTAAQALSVDRQLAPSYGTMNWTRLATMATGIALSCLPEEEKRARIDAARDQRRVEFLPPHDGVMSLTAVLDAVDGRMLEGQVNRLASILATGSQGAAELPRRAWSAQALGVLANPARALHLLQESLLDQPVAIADSTVMADPADACRDGVAAGACEHGAPGKACGHLVVDPDQLLPKVELLVHITDENLLAERGTARSPKLGAIAAGRLRDVLGGCRVSIRPVLKVDALPPHDAYEVPQAMRDAVIFRQPVEAFPWSKRTAKLDLDHTIPYQQGRSGQTTTANLAPLGRRAHRAKTFGGWRTTQPIPGVSIWRSPLGFIYAVTPSGTWELHAPVPRE